MRNRPRLQMAANNLYIHMILLKTQTSIYLKWETPFILCETIGYDLQLVASPLWVQPTKVVRLFIWLTWWTWWRNPLPDQHFYGWALSLPATPNPGLKLLVWLFKITLNPKQYDLSHEFHFLTLSLKDVYPDEYRR